MKLPMLSEVNNVYECASNYVIQRTPIKYDEFGHFCNELNLLRDLIGESAIEPYWQKYFSELRRVRFDFCAVPFLNDDRDRHILDIYTNLSKHLKICRMTYPNFDQPAFRVLELFKKLYEDGKNPLVDKLIELSELKEEVAWVIKESRLIYHADEVVNSYHGKLNHIKVMHYSQLSSSECFDTVFVIGSPRWFPNSIFTSPRSNEINIIHYSWMRDSWKLPETFIAPYTPVRIKRVEINDSSTLEELSLSDESLLPSVHNQTLITYAGSEGHGEYEDFEARCVTLEGGQAIFMDAEDGANILVIDLEEHEDERVKNIAVRDVKPGTFLLVRTNGGGDYIVPIADQIMGKEAPLARQRQDEWKTLLRQYAIINGLLKTSIDLLDKGSDIANEINVRNWMSSRNIKTRRQEDFLAIMRLIGLEDKSIEYWKTMEFIHSAHRKAGYQLRDLLLTQVNKIPPDDFQRRGKIEFKISQSDEDAGLTAFRIENISDKTFRVSVSKIGVPFELGI